MRAMLLVGMLVVVGCSRGYDPDMPDADDVHSMDWNATLGSMGGTQVGGSLNVQSVHAEGLTGNTAAGITITGAAPGAQHPWHIHTGACGSDGGIVGAMSDYPVLRADANGSATATANPAAGLDPDAAYHVNVHLSPSAMGSYVACGDLSH